MRVCITGSAGFLGSHMVSIFLKQREHEIVLPTSSDCDLREQVQVRELFDHLIPDVVIHLAARAGGIGLNQKYPADLFYENAIMGIMLMHEAYKAGVKKFVQIGTICAYPKYTPVPFKEENLWNGYPEETNAPYGLAKKMLLVQAQAYRKQYGFNAIYLLPVNLYGPGDNFNADSSHVIPALIRKFVGAREKGLPEVTIWGSGKPTREFLYVEDAARGIVAATEHYNEADPVNLGSGNEISIHDLALVIQKEVGYTGNIVYDQSRPDGQPHRRLDVSRAKALFGFEATTDFQEGLRNTIQWYENEKEKTT